MLKTWLTWYRRKGKVLAWFGIAVLLVLNLVQGARALKYGISGFLAPLPSPSPGAEASSPDGVKESFVQIVHAYNQADVLANDTGNLFLLEPYMHTSSPAYRELVDVYRERAERKIAHQVELVRFAVGEVEIAEDTVTVPTQEEWNDRCYNYETGETVYVKRSQLVRHEYELRKLGGDWKIWEIRTTVIAP